MLTYDDWNILGFQGQYSVFQARENTVPDQRVSDLTILMHDLFTEYGRLLISSASAGDDSLANRIVIRMQNLADWWDQFATVGVEGVEEVGINQ